MAKQKYALNPGEKIVFKTSCVRHGFWGAYTHALVITNQCVILEKYGIFSNFKGIERYYYSNIDQAILGKATNGEKQLELYIGGKIEDFALQSGDLTELKVLVMAVCDQMRAGGEDYDFDYYQSILKQAKEDARIIALREKASHEGSRVVETGVEVAGEVVKTVLEAGGVNTKKLSKGVAKALGKKKKGFLGEMVDGVLDATGVRDIQDSFIEIGNEFREEFGLKPKMTYGERKELEALEEKRRKQEIQSAKESSFDRAVAQEKAKRRPPSAPSETEKLSVGEQMALLREAKQLLDEGVLTPEEFEKKKQEILNS